MVCSGVSGGKQTEQRLEQKETVILHAFVNKEGTSEPRPASTQQVPGRMVAAAGGSPLQHVPQFASPPAANTRATVAPPHRVVRRMRRTQQ